MLVLLQVGNMKTIYKSYLSCSLIAICAKVWNCVNLSIFAFSKMGTCSIAITSLSIILIFVVLESPN